MYLIDQSSKTALHIQLYEEIKNDIILHCSVGDKLPSIRKVASTYNLSKTTVESAYRQLYAEGYVDSIPKSGYVVIDTYFDGFESTQINTPTLETKKTEYKYDFFPARLSKDSFPLKLWKRLFAKAIDDSLDFGAYHDGQGELGLRNEIAKYIIKSRGVKCTPKQIIICGGFSDSMELLAKMVKNKYSNFAIENPGYHIARSVFEAYDYKIDKIGVHTNGIDINALESSDAKLVYITPSHQYPTGVSIPISNRLKLLEWAKREDGLIIEDDYDSELSYINRPIPSLQGLDKHDKVVYLGTFAKSLSPALRVSYMVLPHHLLPTYKENFDSHFPRVALTTQKTLELFMAEGHWERHLRKIRTINKKKHNLMRDLLKQKLGTSMKILSQGAGLSILIHPTIPFDLDKLKNLAEESKLKIYFAKERSGGDFEAIRMGFGGFSEEEIVLAVEAFVGVWKEVLSN
ncbi:PLP-dependent aminotransferase family protein [Sulfurimonas sp.]|uniref:MocR-like pyridoxine biosynthesis transcription factor PdxR n=1 Tax=Sulfurimonas sp. TaxID=2022749 RepID=UPI0039E70564